LKIGQGWEKGGGKKKNCPFGLLLSHVLSGLPTERHFQFHDVIMTELRVILAVFG
jgi:hypothetical protein